MDCSTSGFPILHYLPEVCSNSCPLSQWWHPTLSSSVTSFSSCPFPASESFPKSWLFTSVGQSIGISASVLPMNIQGWFSLGLTGLISLQSKGLSRIFSNTTVQQHQFFGWSAFFRGFPGGASGKKPPCSEGDIRAWVRFLGQEDPLEEGMATHSSIHAWRIQRSLAGYGP